MPLPMIKISCQEVTRHNCNVLKLFGGYYADIADIAEAMHVPEEIIYGALWSVQDKQSEALKEKQND